MTSPSSSACLLPHNSTLYTEEKGASVIRLYDRDVVIKRYSDVRPVAGGGLRGNIFEFSQQSRKRLLFTCRNSGHRIKSQVCLTYHESSPINGKIVKENLNKLLTYMRRKFKGLYYLWVLEFQKNGHPHVHLFTSLTPDKETRLQVAKWWNHICQESEANFRFTAHPKNFFKWDMKSGKYLAKQYLAKSIQKDVPDTFKDVGRFWGASRNMVPKYETIEAGYTVPKSLHKMAVRALLKCHERTVKKYAGKRINLRSRHVTRSLPLLAAPAVALLENLLWYSGKTPGHISKQLAPMSLQYGVPF